MLAERRLKSTRRAFSRFSHRSILGIRIAGHIVDVVGFVAAVACLLCFVIHTGFDHPASEFAQIRRALRWIQGVFVVCVAFNILFRRNHADRRRGWLLWIVDGAILLSILPWIYPRPEYPWIAWLDAFLYSPAFLYTTLISYALLTFCSGIAELIGKRTNPSLLLSGSFMVFIFIGSLLLMLPNATYGGIDYADALFVSTSAVCITGLTPVDIYAVFTPMGLVILAILIQIGALGVMTFTSFFALFFSGGSSIYNQLLLRDMIYSRTMNSLIPTLLYILGFTLTVEAAGAFFVLLSIHGQLGLSLEQEIWTALFHSLSAFCNAGFSTIPGGLSNPQLLMGNQSIYWTTSVLVMAGSIGFPILVNFREAIGNKFRRLWNRLRHRKPEPRRIHLYTCWLN